MKIKKHLILFCVACMVVACEKKAPENTAAVEPVKLPMEVSYKGTAVIGSMKNAQIVMECNKRLGELNTDIVEFLADTVTWHMADGFELTASRDSTMAHIKNFI